MPRPKHEEDLTAGQDSFLDVITNIVGILIILVMVVGGRVKQVVLGPAPEPSVAAVELEEEVQRLDETVASAEEEIEGLQAQASEVAAAAEMAADSRLELATAVSAARVELERRKQASDAARVAAAERSTRREALQAEIRQCTLEAEGLRHARATTEEVLAYPTPIGRTVNGEEIHFRIAGDRIAYIPLEELFDLAKNRTQRSVGSITSTEARVESVGPTQGFALDYVIEAKIDQSRGQVLIRSREWVVRPAEPAVGEPVDRALAPSSRFRAVLAGVKPDTTVTLWCYPDSFAAYRQVREELHRLRIATAGRPLPDGAPIGGSAEGSKSVVQ
ncbi:MAG: hypothetical protein DWI03_03400 [Planctomycetota bacterium]|nr:MAG: hypothetical protein DWI03_03400 [Planctomycetota bacterium]